MRKFYGLAPIKYIMLKKKKSKKIKEKKKFLEQEIFIGGVKLVQKEVFARHLSIMLKSGLNIIEALEIAVDSTAGGFKKVLLGVSNTVRSGYTLSDSLARYPKVFSSLFISAVFAGETSGTLGESLKGIADQLEKEKKLSSKIKGAMLYPLIILVAALMVGMAMAFWVLPKIIPLFKGLKVELPLTTQLLIKFSAFIEQYGTHFLISSVIFIFFAAWLLRQNFVKPFTHFLILKIPIVKKISINSNLARFCDSLAVLLKSGMNLDESLKISKNMVDNYYYKKSIEKTGEEISKGSKLSSDLSQYKKLYPLMVIKMVRVGEESGNLAETLKYLGDFYEAEVDNDVKTISVIIEPVLLIFIGLGVGFLALSIITPIYNITGGLKR